MFLEVTMKVIKEGKWNVVWTTEITCPVCEAKLMVEESDVKPTVNVMRYECTCPICGKTVVIPNNQIAQRVRETADKKRTYYSSSSWGD